MKLAYLTTEYPAVSHTFIRREIVGLEQLGHTIFRYSIRDCGMISDPIDEIEKCKTFYCLPQGLFRLLLAGALTFLLSPYKTFKTLRLMLSFSNRSDRGLVRHFGYFFEAALLLREFDKEDIKHVHVHFGTNSTAVALLISELGGPSYSFTVHGPDEFDSPIGFWLSKKIANSVFTVGISNYCSAQLKRWANYNDWEKIKIVRCIVSSEFLTPTPKIDADSKTLVCVGRLSAQKGHLVLIDAVNQLVERGFEFQLVLVGDGELRPLIEKRIKELGLGDHIQITGWVCGKQIRELLISSKGLVMPSFAEGLPVVLMEALAMMRPVVSTHINGIPELVIDGKNGFLVIPDDIESLANGIGRLLATPVEKLNQMGQVGREIVNRTYTAEIQIPILEECFKAVLENQDSD